MAKKGPERKESPSSGGRAHPSENRIQKLKTAEMQQLVEDARQWLAATENTLILCKEKKIDAFVVDGATKLERAIQLLSDFAGHVYKGANKAIGEQRRAQASGELES